MKFKTLCSVAVVAAITTGALAPMAANAETEAKSLLGHGEVTYEEDDSKNLPGDPEDPDGTKVDPDKDKNPDIELNEDGGPITIDAVTNLTFPNQKIGVSPKPTTDYAKPVTLTLTDGTTVTRGNYVQWTDKRAGNDHTYQIKAAMTKQFTNGSNKLENATISYANGFLNSNMPAANWSASRPEAFVLTQDGAGKLVYDNSTSTGAQGLGTFYAEFGTSTADAKNTLEEASTGLAGESVQLSVPAGQSIVKGKYVADITWSIEYTPAPAAPETPEA
ncbi:WxL domain-containing protein [Candidatus Enterococcus ikei]|uniref:WxL domain-containing protein n=1 Tax=Candidatus Enterococcus ikei TaxID=2815326 RepID=A0ABS3H0R9_9ENTE|nr:WxL domain-containing protein [Enterococcus sp. DIV0869a]MBO0441105.1 WxL domain-containing protein [Enterococcus sp. DIV0869a]